MASEEITGCAVLESSPLDTIMEGQSSGDLNRRSLSIFSRRGTSTPKPQIDRMPSVISRPSAPAAQRRSSIMFRNRKQEPKIPEGTILRAVPQAQAQAQAPNNNLMYAARSLSTLELEMATSPNEEILSAIGLPSPPVSPISPRSPYSSTSSSPDRLAKSVSQTMRLPTKRSRARSNSTKDKVIGVWKEGRTQWMPGTIQRAATQPETRPATATSPTLVSPRAQSQRAARPRIQVIIPNHRLNAPLPSIPFFNTSNTSYPSVDATISAGPSSASSAEIPMGSIERTTTITRSTSASLIPYQPQPQRPVSMASRKFLSVDQSPTSIRQLRPSVGAASSSSEGSSSNTEEEEMSNYSRSARSSITSFGSDKQVVPESIASKTLGKRTGSQAFSILSPAAAGIYDDGSGQECSPLGYSPSIAELPGSSPIEQCSLSRSSSQALPQRRWSKKRMSSRRGTKLMSIPPRRLNEDANTTSLALQQAEDELESTLSSINEDKQSSPAENGAAIFIAELPAGPDLPPPLPPKSKRRPTVAYRTTKEPAVSPAVELPKAYRALAERSRTLRNQRRDLRSRSVRRVKSQSMPNLDELCLEDMPESGELQHEEQRRIAQREITAQQAEHVILRIMESLVSLDDLFSTAILNKGFYRVFKRHEMQLSWGALRHTSPAAWEYMKTLQASLSAQCSEEDEVPEADFTPASFLRNLIESHAVLLGLKSLLLAKCQPFLRSSTVAALSDADPSASERVDAALWRIWTFCRTFGSNRGREDDIVGQMDWLRGGVLAHQQTCTSTIVSSDSFGLSDVLLNASEHFGRGNGNKGLSAEDLLDMIELWASMTWLVRGLEGRMEHARQYGIFDHTEVRGGDIDGEELMLGKFEVSSKPPLRGSNTDRILEEYASYFLTLGLEPILTIASALQSVDEASLNGLVADATPFAVAYDHGWTQWSPPSPGTSRTEFLKEPLARLYQERIHHSSDRQQAQARSEYMEEIRRQKGHSLADELRRSQRSMDCPRSGRSRPLRLMDERPMSNWELVLSKFAQAELASSVAAAESTSNGSVAMSTSEQFEKEVNTSDGRSTPATTASSTSSPHFVYNKEFGPSSSRSSSPRLPALPSSPHSFNHSSALSSTASLNDIHPAFRTEVEQSRAASRGTMYSSSTPEPVGVGFTHHPLQTQLMPVATTDPATNSADRAVLRIVEMGFTAEQARYALMKTDTGDGLKIDRAVEMLLRQ